MIPNLRVEPFLDHNLHVGLSFYSSDVSLLLRQWSEELKSAWGEDDVVLVLAKLGIRFIRECQSTEGMTRTLSALPHKAKANAMDVAIEYWLREVRVARVDMTCSAIRSHATASQGPYDALFGD